MATTAELKEQIDAWVATFIHQVIQFKAPLAPTAERLNELFNLLIAQGDDTADMVKTIRDYLDSYTEGLDTAIAATVQSQFDILAAPLTTNVQAAAKAAQDAATAAQAAKASADNATTVAVQAASIATQAADTADAAAQSASDATATANNAAVAANQAATNAANSAATFSVAELAGGTATALTLQNLVLTDGYIKSFIPKYNNGGAVTTINSKPVYVDGTTNNPIFEVTKMYTVHYSTANGGCFFVKASAIGNAVAADVLAPKTFSNSTGVNIAGTIPSKGSATYNPYNVTRVIAAGQYLSGGQTIMPVTGDAVAADVLTGKTFWSAASGVVQTGTATAGKKVQSGRNNATTSVGTYIYLNGTSNIFYTLTVTGLGFIPGLIVAKWKANSYTEYTTIYEELPNGLYPKTVKITVNDVSTSSQTTYNFKGDVSPANVVYGTFSIPVAGNGVLYDWIAYEK
jgi:hypothetical protein